ncbi:CTP synthase [Candida parapsilosis]|nr:CTP synthase [Candida parapsilosis]
MKYVVVSGGVISGIGKGVLASSTGLLFKTLGLRVTSIKIDPYMNIDAGTMSPLEHGECFVLNDGGEVDLDLGNYERYLNITLTKNHNITTGKIYSKVIERERKGDYLGKTVQVVPHITNAIQEWIEDVSRIPVDDTGLEPEVCIIELGGTVGDIESAPFVEALRQFQFRVGSGNFALIHVSLVPVIHGEQKTKPTQAAIKDLRSLGLTPDMIACRCQEELQRQTIEKIGMFCHVGPDQVIAVHDVNSTYHVPLLLKQQKMMNYLTTKLTIGKVDPQALAKGEELLNKWRHLTTAHDKSFETVTIALVGKYTNLHDSYLSVIKSLEHASMRCNRRLKIEWVESTNLEEGKKEENLSEYHKAWHYVCQADGILVPGGFGSRGIEGMIAAAKYARENNIPYLGVCLGLQIAVIEFVRNVIGIANSTSQEFDEYKEEQGITPSVVYMPDVDQVKLGGTMRLGIHETKFSPDSQWSNLRKLYGGADAVYERHRHRYEVNPALIRQIEEQGLKFIGRDESGNRMEMIELDHQLHKFFIGTQYHPEYLSKVLDPSRPFLGLVAASAGILEDVLSRDDLNYKGEF